MKQALNFDPFSLLKNDLPASEVDFGLFEVLPDVVATPMEQWTDCLAESRQ